MSINRREFMKRAGSGAAGLGMALGAQRSFAQNDGIKWNVLLFSSDQHNPKIMGCDGTIGTTVRTPHMDQLASEGTLFMKAYCTFPVCAPTRSSLMTAEFPQKHKQFGNEGKLLTSGPNGAAPSIAHLFRARGYNTALIGKTHSNNQTRDSLPEDPTFMGFDYRLEKSVTSDGLGGAKIPNDEVFDTKKNAYRAANAISGGDPAPAWEGPIWDQANETEDWDPGDRFRSWCMNHPGDNNDGLYYYDSLAYLEEYSAGVDGGQFRLNTAEPFFLFVSVVQPHWPFSSPRMQDGIDFYGMYSGRPEDDDIPGKTPVDMPSAEEMAFEMSEYPGAKHNQDAFHWKEITPEAKRLSRARYYSAVSWVDHLLGKTLEKLEALDDPNNPGKKLSETTIVCYTSDHGDMMGEKDYWWKYVMFDGAARVPLIMRMPGTVPAGVRSDLLINHVDILPTLAGLAGMGDGLRSGTDGQDLSLQIQNNAPHAGPERTYSMLGIWASDQHPNVVMSRSQKYKFIRERSKRPDGDPNMVLFDMDKDPHETTNLAFDPRYRGIVERENAAMNAYVARYEIAPVAVNPAPPGQGEDPPANQMPAAGAAGTAALTTALGVNGARKRT